ncbi:MAG: hypothetical protein KatS3mg081_1558 [Gemmatimonadales bacterium]|nr:MAG: hypothetical protein KatS3mg081_1558 [Gemmatimonadales bacterium]
MEGKRFPAFHAALMSAAVLLVFAQGAALAQALSGRQLEAEGQDLFGRQCAACHTIGGGSVFGPDLLGVTGRRDRAWLLRWIKEPDKVLAQGDPIAVELLAQFNNLPMPNLQLSDRQVEAVLSYLESVDAGGVQAKAGRPPLYIPTLIASMVVLGGLTAVGLLVARKTVEVRA